MIGSVRRRPWAFAFALAVTVASGLPSQAQQDTPKKSGDATTITPPIPATTTRPAVSAATMQIKKGLSGDFQYRFVSKSNATAPNPLPSASADNLVALPLPSDIKPAETQVEIVDLARGNVARLPVSTTIVANLAESDFKWVQTVTVPVMAKGRGVIGPQVTLETEKPKYKQQVTLKPADNGLARFENVPLNESLKVTVSYGANPSVGMTQTLLPSTSPEGVKWPTMEIAWPDVKTVAAPPPVTAPTGVSAGLPPTTLPAPAGTAAPAAPPLPQSAGPFSQIASLIISLAVLGGMLYGVYWAYNTGRLKTVFEKLGIQTTPLAESGPAAPNPFKQERTPLTPITEGTADPLAGGGIGTAGATAVVVSAGPRLIATMGTYAGNIFPLNGPSLDIGRDTNNGLPMPNDTNASRRHATIQNDNGQYMVVDHGSSNGTFVNGVRIAGAHPLRPGDEVHIGATRFRFEA